jgi:hypothetical protein
MSIADLDIHVKLKKKKTNVTHSTEFRLHGAQKKKIPGEMISLPTHI